MATRGRIQRGEEVKAVGTFQGRVRKWRKVWLTAGGTREGGKLLFNVWQPTQERSQPHTPRPNMVPVENPNSKPPLPRFPPVGPDAKALKRARASLSGLGTEDPSATPAASEGVSAGVTQRTDATAAPKIIRFKLKSSATLAPAAAAPSSAAGPAVPAGSPPLLATGAAGAAGGGATPRLGPIRLRVEPGAEPAGQQGGGVAAAAPAPTAGGAGGEDEEDLELCQLEPQEPCSPRNLDALIPDMAAAARHDATAVLLASGGGGAGPAAGQGPPPGLGS